MFLRLSLWCSFVVPGLELSYGAEGWAVVTMLVLFVALVVEKWNRERNNESGR